MGYDFVGRCGASFKLNIYGWPSVFRLAQAYGWKPMGTIDPDPYFEHDHTDPAWKGSYFHNHFQTVQYEDAKNLADALEKALNDIPDEKLTGLADQDIDPRKFFVDEQLEKLYRTILSKKQQKKFEALADVGGHKQYLRDFIVFCRKGSFMIG